MAGGCPSGRAEGCGAGVCGLGGSWSGEAATGGSGRLSWDPALHACLGSSRIAATAPAPGWRGQALPPRRFPEGRAGPGGGLGARQPPPRFTGQGRDPEVGSPPPRPHPESRPSSPTRCVTEIPTPRREQASGARRSTCARGPRWHGPACWQAAGARGSGTAGVDRPQSAPGAPQVKLAAPSPWRKRSRKSLRPGRPAGVRREKFGSGVRIGVSGPRKHQVRGGKVRGKRKKGILIWGGRGRRFWFRRLPVPREGSAGMRGPEPLRTHPYL